MLRGKLLLESMDVREDCDFNYFLKCSYQYSFGLLQNKNMENKRRA